MTSLENNRTCKKGHRYTKTSDCPTCPICEAEKNQNQDFYLFYQLPLEEL
mgnify:CR=1 FL=1